MIWESIKAPLRQGLLFAYAFLLNKGFDWIASTIGFNFTEEQKLQLMGFGTPIVWSILSFIDRYMHELGKEAKDQGNWDSPLLTGLTRF